MSPPYSFEDLLTALKSHKSQVDSHNYVMHNQKIVPVLLDNLLPPSPNRMNVQALFNRHNFTIDTRLAETLATMVNNLRKQRTKNIRAH